MECAFTIDQCQEFLTGFRVEHYTDAKMRTLLYAVLARYQWLMKRKQETEADEKTLELASYLLLLKDANGDAHEPVPLALDASDDDETECEVAIGQAPS
jgi:hypothetical protein